ncbi:hypothetical protein H0A73_17410 [Alcaligenaceae bacterium]|nr:hypothetical protein [Alcaligenaceae bacterium]
MASLQEINSTLYNALKQMLPGLPDGVRKLSLHLEQGKPPALQIEHIQMEANGGVKTPVDFNSNAFTIMPLGDDDTIDVTLLSDLERRYAVRPKTDALLERIIERLDRIEANQGRAVAVVSAVPGQ